MVHGVVSGVDLVMIQEKNQQQNDIKVFQYNLEEVNCIIIFYKMYYYCMDLDHRIPEKMRRLRAQQSVHDEVIEPQSSNSVS